MGGAYVAVEDGLAAALYNPANGGGYRGLAAGGFKLFLNPWTPGLALSDPERFFRHSEAPVSQAFAMAGLLIKGFTLGVGRIDLAAVIAEQATGVHLLPSAANETAGYLDNQFNLMALRLRLAERVSLGCALGLYYYVDPGSRREWKLRASYGITLAPDRKVLVGVSYITLPPDSLGAYRQHPERLVDGSVNLGISYKPARGTTLAFDFRNLVEERTEMVREPHLGVEQAIFSVTALRAGAFRQSETGEVALTAGLGVVDLGSILSSGRNESMPNWLFNYGIVVEKSGGVYNRFIHALSVSLRI